MEESGAIKDPVIDGPVREKVGEVVRGGESVPVDYVAFFLPCVDCFDAGRYY